jgi:hypothetical protein
MKGYTGLSARGSTELLVKWRSFDSKSPGHDSRYAALSAYLSGTGDRGFTVPQSMPL